MDAVRFGRAFYRYQLAASVVFIQPIFFVYYLDVVGLELATVLGLQSYNVALRACLEVPSGVLADRWSRRGCLVGSALAIATGAAVLLVAPSFVAALVAETAFGTAHALRSGADSALLHDGMSAAGAIGLYPRAEGRARAIGAAASGAAALAGGLLAEIGITWPYVATIAAALLAAVFALGLPEPRHDRSVAPGTMRPALEYVARHAAVRWTIALAMLSVVASHVYFYFQQPYLKAVGAPLWLFGATVAATKAVNALVAVGAHRADLRLGARGTAATMTAVATVGLGGMAVVTSPVGAGLILTRGVLDGLWEPLLNVYQNRLVPTHLRATLLSVQNLAARLALAAAIWGLGRIAGEVGVHGAVGAGAALACVVGVTLVMLGGRPQVRERLAGASPCDS